MNNTKLQKIIVWSKAIIWLGVSLYFFLIPAGILLYDLQDPGLKSNQIPHFAYRWHKQMTPGFATWATDRVQSQQATQLKINNVSGTEWPMFSSVYYLWATESLQADWEQQPTTTEPAPVVYAGTAIESAAALISDPNNAAWVRQYWGDDYLNQENLFYRMLLIAGLTSYQTLTDNAQYEPLLREQVIGLAQELDASPYGLLDDYPGQCYPIDILPAIAVIRRADTVLGTDHSAFAQRAVRGFQATRLDADTGLPAYIANAKTGQGHGQARGVGMSYMLIWSPELWADTSHNWYESYEAQFWQQQWGVVGFREFSHATDINWTVDVDAGPVIGGFGTAANAFGIGAARVNGRFDQAYALGAEALVASWSLPNGKLVSARLLSNLSDAPYTGETALLFNFTRQTKVAETTPATNLPLIVYVGWGVYVGLGIAGIYRAVYTVRRFSNPN